MNRIFVSILAMLAFIMSACEQKPERVVEKAWTPEQPKLVAYYLEKDGKKIKQREEKFYEDGVLEYEGGLDEQGKRHGEWRYYYKTGTLWSLGVYQNGLMEGKKEVYWPDGKKRYEGYFSNDKKSGHWTFYNMDGSILQERDF
ncbi:MAG: hypothetical protein R2813_06535 [Flavobacteriales bacterium]